jgi:hypothetical protein
VRLAARLEVPLTDLAVRLGPDTVRRTRYPVTEETQADGKVEYRHKVEFFDGPRSR